MASIRLICPNCGATYEIDASAIPLSGRDVQCSNCAHIWFETPDDPTARAEDPAAVAPDSQRRPEDEPAVTSRRSAPPEPEPEAEPDLEPDDDSEAQEGAADEALHDADPEDDLPGAEDETGDAGTEPATDDADDIEAAEPAPRDPPASAPAPAAPRRTLDSSIADILREEAAREEAARRAEDEGRDTFETQGDLTLDPPAPAPDRSEPEAPPQAAAPAERRDPPARLARLRGAPEPAARGPRADVFPDIEEINSSLDRPRGPEFTHDDDGDTKGGGRSGFLTVLAVIALAVLIYAMAPQIAEAVPALADPLAAYADLVDAGRIWLDTQVRALADMVGAG